MITAKQGKTKAPLHDTNPPLDQSENSESFISQLSIPIFEHLPPLSFRKGNTPLGLKLLESRCKKGVYISGFTASSSRFHGPAELDIPLNSASSPVKKIMVGDFIKSIGTENVGEMRVAEVKKSIEKSRKLDKLRGFISSSSYIDKKIEQGVFMMILERPSCKYTLREILVDPRKVPFLLHFFKDPNRGSTGRQESFDSVHSVQSNEPASFIFVSSRDANLVRFIIEAQKLQEFLKLFSYSTVPQNLMNKLNTYLKEIQGDDFDATKVVQWEEIEPIVKSSEEELAKTVLKEFQDSAWFSRMLSSLRGSPTYIHFPLQNLFYDEALRSIFMAHLIQFDDGRKNWLKVWRMIEFEIRPLMSFLENSIFETQKRLIEWKKWKLIEKVEYIWNFYLSPQAHFRLPVSMDLLKNDAPSKLFGLSNKDKEVFSLSIDETITLGNSVCSIQPIISEHIASEIVPKFYESYDAESIGGELCSFFGAERVGSTAPESFFSYLWERCDKEQLIDRFVKSLRMPPYISRHRPSLQQISDEACAEDEYKEGIKSMNEKIEKRRFGRARDPRQVHLKNGLVDPSPDWAMYFEGFIDSKGIVGCRISSCKTIGGKESVAPLKAGIEPFLCPDLYGKPVWSYQQEFGENSQSSSRLYTFTIPRSEGIGRYFGACLCFFDSYEAYINDDEGKGIGEESEKKHYSCYLPRGICLLSENPSLSFMKGLLKNYYSEKVKGLVRQTSHEFFSSSECIGDLVRFVEKTILSPEEGQENSSQPLPTNISDSDMEVFLRCLHPRNICLILLYLLEEGRVVLVSEQFSLLTTSAEILLALLSPLSWCHVYVPVLPQVMADTLLDCPTPYLIGLLQPYMAKASKIEIPDGTLRVNLDTGEVHCFGAEKLKDIEPLLPTYNALKKAVSINWTQADSLVDRGREEKIEKERIFETFEELMNSLLRGCWEVCTCVGIGEHKIFLFDGKAFEDLKMTQFRDAAGSEKCLEFPYKYDEKFFEKFVETQMLSNYLSLIYQRENLRLPQA